MLSEAAQTFPPTTSDHKKTHQFDSYVFVGVEVLSCRERQKKKHWKRASLCITPPTHPLQSPGDCTTSPTGSAAPKPRTRPQGVSRSRSPLRCVATRLLITPRWGTRIPPPAAGGRCQAGWEGAASLRPPFLPGGLLQLPCSGTGLGGRGGPRGCRDSVAAGPRPSTQPPLLGPSVRWRRGSGAGRS